MGALLGLLALAAAACSGASNGSASDGGAPLVGRAVEATKSTGPLAPDFTVPTRGGPPFTLRDHRGEIIVLYFSFPG